ncbi:MAG: DnaB-like helicase C-terminal domain-containing protein [Romboutsia sp.]
MKSRQRKYINKYYDNRAALQILGCLMKQPNLLKSKKYKLSELDFITPHHKALYITIYNLSNQGAEIIGLNDVETYLHNSRPLDYTQLFEKEFNGSEWITKTIEDASPYNFEYYYNMLIKMSILRSKIESGVDVGEILDKNEMDTNIISTQLEKLDNMSIKDLLDYFDKKNLESKRRFIVEEEEADRKCGDKAEELREQMKKEPNFGFSTESEYFNTITRGWRRKGFYLETRDSGMGKTRVAIKRLLQVTSPKLWDEDTYDFLDNESAIGNSALYIGTEMDTYEELEPMMWAFVSGVDEDRIRRNELTEEEDERVNTAINILKKTNLFLVDEEDFDVTYLWYKVEQYVTEYNICAAALDYIELNNALVSEYIQETRGMGAREDQVLLNLSRNIKNIAKNFNLAFFSFTQTTDEARRDNIRDQRAVKGARSLPNKADVGIVTFEPTKKEIDLLEPILEKSGLVENKYPNVCYSFYKNRGGRIKNVKIWGYQNLGTMRFVDLFCTDHSYAQIAIDKTKIA